MIKTISREQSALIVDRAEWPHIIPQWRTAEGEQRGVMLRALSMRDRMDALNAATRRDGTVDAIRQVIEEVARGIVKPAEIPTSVIETWNAAVVLEIHARLTEISDFIPSAVETELQRLAGAAGIKSETADDAGGN
jgi:hypothetical protein